MKNAKLKESYKDKETFLNAFLLDKSIFLHSILSYIIIILLEWLKKFSKF